MAKKLTLDLSVFKSSGVYTLEFDASENIVVNPQTVRLVVGFSTKGPFNTPVYVPDVQTALKVFGDIDRSLEKKGSFFHRSIFTCLNSGPVFALNLLKLNNTVTELSEPDVANGADVAWYDPLVSVWQGLSPVDLNWDCDIAILATNQPGMNLEKILLKGVQILDCTNSINGLTGVVSL
jgi:hypothetical protein